MKTTELKDGGIIVFDDTFLPVTVADRYFTDLRDHCQWEQKPGIFGHMQPRLIASYGDEGDTYKYSGVVNVALPWTATLLEIKRKIEAVQGDYNYCLLNRYRSGLDSMGWHADDEPEMGNVIGSLSLGATRKFRIRHNVNKETKTFLAGNGTLIIMAGTMQQFWQHEVQHQQFDNFGRRIELATFLARTVSEVFDQVFVSGTQQVRELEIIIGQQDVGEVLDEVDQCAVIQSSLTYSPIEVDAFQNVLKRIRIGIFHRRQCLVQPRTDVGLQMSQSLVHSTWRLC